MTAIEPVSYEIASSVLKRRISDQQKSKQLLIALICVLLVTNICAVLYIIRLLQTKDIPDYITILDKNLLSSGIASPSPTNVEMKAITKAHLARFITDLRSVSPDYAVMNKSFLRVNSMIIPGSPAYTRLQRVTREENPFEKAKAQAVAVTVTTVIPLSKNGWELEWSEEISGKRGEYKATKHYRGLVQVTKTKIRDEQIRIINPLGIVIEHFEFSEKIV